MEAEIKVCQNCKASFVIDAQDFDFYKKIDVPPPTFCPACRLQRRYAWRNERLLFKTKCANCKRDIFSGYHPSNPFPVFCHDCWFSDAWNPLSYGRSYDFSKPFFLQFKELFDQVPRLNLWQLNCVNSPYSNIIRDAKDCYLSFSMVIGEEVFYSKNIDRSHQLFDCLNVTDSEKCSWIVYGDKNYNAHYSVIVRSCLDSLFLFDCHNARNCFMSSNLRNKEFVFRNRQLTKEAYREELKKINTGSLAALDSLRGEFEEMRVKALHKYADIVKSANATGDALANVKNVRECFEGYDLEDVSYGQRVLQLKDAMDVSNTGVGSELMYEYVSGGAGERNLKFSIASFGALQDCTYAGWCKSSANLFGCFGMKDGHYCILNKPYSKEEYEVLVPRIIKHMNEMPYEGKAGRVYRYGEFFPIELSPFAYNQSVAQEYRPLSKDEILKRGYNWRDPEAKSPAIDVKPKEVSDHIRESRDGILEKTIGCAHEGTCLDQCTSAFRVVPRELEFYRTQNFPLPRLCPNCRHYERLRMKNPWRLYDQQCMCDYLAYRNTVTHPHHPEGRCPNKFKTSYAPDRKEIVYCEPCYNAEVV
ncbi:MAG: hypothetical protein HY435_01860 [Candidatus Liptonbacteria bacterium]|nr:hypothetical protein [Candidatus Liptonbacteria bacterium]